MRRTIRFRPALLLPWIGLALVLLGLGFVVWWGAVRGGASALELLAWDDAGLVRDAVTLRVPPNDPLGPDAHRVPLILALRNTGKGPVGVDSVALSLPSWLRVERDDGTVVAGVVEGGNPLTRYVIDLGRTRIEPGAFPTVLPGARRLWLRPFASPYRCTLDDDGLPAFLPAPPLEPDRLAATTVFWSVEEGRANRRSTGTLSLRMDPGLFEVEPVSRLPVYPVRELPPEAPRPDLGRLEVLSRRETACGGLIEPLTLRAVAYRAGAAGRIFAVSVDSGPTRLLFDLDGDSIIEAEAWSTTGGRLDRVRPARYATPAFLNPPPPPPEPPVDTAAVADSLARLAADSVRGDSVRADSAAVRTPAPARTDTAAARVPPPDTSGVS